MIKRDIDRLDRRILAELIAAGAEVNAQDEDGDTTLHNAARHAHSEGTLQALLEGGADVTIRNGSGKSAWHYAQQKTP